jgi:hypothetical protein
MPGPVSSAISRRAVLVPRSMAAILALTAAFSPGRR